MFGHKWARVLVLGFMGLAITGIAYAANTVIDTNDGQVDSNWAVVPVLSSDGDDFANDNYDINQAWVASAPDQSAFYFRVSLVGAGQLPHNYSSFEARLDCDRNGSFLDASDVVVYYAISPSFEELVECQGSDYSECDYNPEPNLSDSNLDTFGEEVSAGSFNYEWRADVTNGQADWSQCLGDVNIQFASLDNTLAEQDLTAWQGYNIPTAVELIEIHADSQAQPYPAVQASAGLLSLFVGAWLIKRFKRHTT